MSAPLSGGAASDATVEIADDAPGRTPAQQEYLDKIADEAEAAIGTVEQMIADLQASLADRRNYAEQARAEANNGRVTGEELA